MRNTNLQDRAAGAIMGAFIGDAMGVGPHWYYDLAELRRDHGEWITGYTDPRPGRYHEGLRAGQLSQPGFILALTLRSLVEGGGYDQEDFCGRMDRELFPLLDGTPACGPGGYTSQSIREAWRRRVREKLPWGKTGGHADTTEAIERTLAIAVCYALQPALLAEHVTRNTVLTQTDDTVVSITVAFGAVLSLLVQGQPFDARLSGRLMDLVATGELPFHTVTREGLHPRLRTRMSVSSRPGRFPLSTACRAPSTTRSRRPTTLPHAFATTSNPPCSTQSTAAARTRRAPSSPAPWPARRPGSPPSPGVFWTAWRTLRRSLNWPPG